MLPEIFFGLNPKSIELRSVDYERIFNLLGMEHVGNASTCILSNSALSQKIVFCFSITILEEKILVKATQYKKVAPNALWFVHILNFEISQTT